MASEHCSACALINALLKDRDRRICNSCSHFEPIYDTMKHTIGNNELVVRPEGHMMLSKTIKFPNNIANILSFKMSYKSRRYDIGDDITLFNEEKSNTYPMYCVCHSGKKYSLFGDNFLSIKIRTFLCTIANYNKAKDYGAPLKDKIEAMSEARYDMDQQ